MAGRAALLHAGGELDGEPVLLRARLSERWLCMRACTCCCALTWVPFVSVGIPLCGLLYLAAGAGARRAEYDSFELCLTPTALHYSMKNYDCGCCCQKTVKKTIPLDKIQDIMLVSDCIGDRCGFAAKGQPWQLHVQTAGLSGPEARAELIAYCLEDPEEFRTKVLQAKRALGAGGAGAATGAAKEGGSAGGGASGAGALAAGGDTAAVVAVLERIERAVNEGLARMPPRH